MVWQCNHLIIYRTIEEDAEHWVFGIVDISTRPATGYMQLVAQPLFFLPSQP